MGKPGGRVLVAVDDGSVVGTAELHPDRPAAGGHVANAGFMVSPHAAGRVVGRALAQRTREVAARRWVRGDAVPALSLRPTSTQSACGSRSASQFSPPSRKLFRHPDRGLVGLHTSCTGSCDSRPSLSVRPGRSKSASPRHRSVAGDWLRVSRRTRSETYVDVGCTVCHLCNYV